MMLYASKDIGGGENQTYGEHRLKSPPEKKKKKKKNVGTDTKKY